MIKSENITADKVGYYGYSSQDILPKRSKMLNTVTPYLLCAASHVIDPKCSNNVVNDDSTTTIRVDNVRVRSRSKNSMSKSNNKRHVDVTINNNNSTDTNNHDVGINVYPNQTDCLIEENMVDCTSRKNNVRSESNEIILSMLHNLMNRQRIEDDCIRRQHEWRQLSVLIDKILFWIFMIVTVFTSILFLFIIPIQRRGFYSFV